MVSDPEATLAHLRLLGGDLAQIEYVWSTRGTEEDLLLMLYLVA